MDLEKLSKEIRWLEERINRLEKRLDRHEDNYFEALRKQQIFILKTNAAIIFGTLFIYHLTH